MQCSTENFFSLGALLCIILGMCPKCQKTVMQPPVFVAYVVDGETGDEGKK